MQDKKATIINKIKQLKKELYDIDPELLNKQREYHREYNKTHSDKIKQYKKKFYEKHPDYNKKYYEKHKQVKGNKEENDVN